VTACPGGQASAVLAQAGHASSVCPAS